MPDFVDTPEGLSALMDRLRDAPALAVDTETDAFFAYRPKVCLLQFSVPGYDALVDPLADIDLSSIGSLLRDRERLVVLHAAENDVILMHHQFGWRIGQLFDTQVACFVLGLSPYSLAGVLEARFGVKLDKSQQRSDWSLRPLDEKQIRYAAEDTRHLLELAAELQRRAREAGRAAEIEWECRRIAEREWEPEPFDPNGFRRLPGAKESDPVTQRVLRDLYLFRNGEAERRNRAPYRVASDHALAALARWRGQDPPKGVPPGLWRRYGKQLRRVIHAAREKGPLPPPKRRRNAGDSGATPPDVKERYERLRKWRTQAAAERGVESFVVARNELLMRIARAAPRDLDELGREVQPFRVREYGDAILAVLGVSGNNKP